MDAEKRERAVRAVLRTTLREVLKDGTFDEAEKAALGELCKALAIPQEIFDAVLAEVRAATTAEAGAGSMDVAEIVKGIRAELGGVFEPAQAASYADRIAVILNAADDGPLASPSAETVVAAPAPEPSPAPPPGPGPTPEPPASAAPADRAEELEQRFIGLVEDSWRRFDEVERATWVDDAFVGHVIKAHLDHGRFLLDLTSDGTAHYLVFSSKDRVRNVVRLDHSRAEDFSFAKAVGHLTTVTLGYSKAFPDISKILSAVRSELKSGLAGTGRIEGYEDPGVIKVDAEGTFATAATALLLDLKDHVDLETLGCDTARLWEDFSAVYQSLEKYLEGIMQ